MIEVLFLVSIANAGSGAWEGLAKQAHKLSDAQCQAYQDEAQRKKLKPVENSMLLDLARNRVQSYKCSQAHLETLALPRSEEFKKYVAVAKDLLDIRGALHEDAKTLVQKIRDPKVKAAEHDEAQQILSQIHADIDENEKVIKHLPFGGIAEVRSALVNYGETVRPQLMVATPQTQEWRRDGSKNLELQLAAAFQKVRAAAESDRLRLSELVSKGPAEIDRTMRDSLIEEAIELNPEAFKKGTEDERKALCHLRQKHGEGARYVDYTITAGLWASLGWGKMLNLGKGLLAKAGQVSGVTRAAPITSGVTEASLVTRARPIVAHTALAGVNLKLIQDTCGKKFADVGDTSIPGAGNPGAKSCPLYSPSSMDAALCGVAGFFAAMQARALVGSRLKPMLAQFLKATGYGNFLSPGPIEEAPSTPRNPVKIGRQ